VTARKQIAMAEGDNRRASHLCEGPKEATADMPAGSNLFWKCQLKIKAADC
jgi:hypothetical protein